MANVLHTENMTEDQLDAMAGSETLRALVTSFGMTRNNKVDFFFLFRYFTINIISLLFLLTFKASCLALWIGYGAFIFVHGLVYFVITIHKILYLCLVLQALLKSTNRLRDSLIPKDEPKLAIPLLLLIAQHRSL